MRVITAWRARRQVRALLDAVGHRRKPLTVAIDGRAVATSVPPPAPRDVAVKQLLAEHRRDAGWATEVCGLRAGLNASHSS